MRNVPIESSHYWNYEELLLFH